MTASLTKPEMYLKTELEKLKSANISIQSDIQTVVTAIEKLSPDGWRDLLAPFIITRQSGNRVPTFKRFGPDNLHYILKFDNLDEVYITVHVPHSIKPNTLAYPYIYWSTDGTDTGIVSWELSYTIAKGHGQEPFGSSTTIIMNKAATGIPWTNMITEADISQAILFEEPDTIILVKIKRSETGNGNHHNGPDTNTDKVFGIMAAFHYQTDRRTTSFNKEPDFYTDNNP
ncbi:MAG: hypothetical protein DRG78_03365 [Epsilonproteobacteria bacterium]|nr:MAG: hypothetical protein DRG78_03365 [Campylobacterota bacterium]